MLDKKELSLLTFVLDAALTSSNKKEFKNAMLLLKELYKPSKRFTSILKKLDNVNKELFKYDNSIHRAIYLKTEKIKTGSKELNGSLIWIADCRISREKRKSGYWLSSDEYWIAAEQINYRKL